MAVTDDPLGNVLHRWAKIAGTVFTAIIAIVAIAAGLTTLP